jgi:hypothetical protein
MSLNEEFKDLIKYTTDMRIDYGDIKSTNNWLKYVIGFCGPIIMFLLSMILSKLYL